MKKILVIGAAIFTTFTLMACGNSKTADTPKADYPTAEKLENALNKGKSVKNKTVKFKISAVEPNSAFGFNLETGKHLNFISEDGKAVKSGDTVTAKIKKTTQTLGSWLITYSDLTKNDKKVSSKALSKSTVTSSSSTGKHKSIPTNATSAWFFQDPVFYAGNETLTLKKSEVQDSDTAGEKNLVIYASILNNSNKEQDPSNFYMVLEAKQKTSSSNVTLDVGMSKMDEDGNSTLQSYEDNLNNALLPHKNVDVVFIYTLKNTNPVTLSFKNENFDNLGTKTYEVQ